MNTNLPSFQIHPFSNDVPPLAGKVERNSSSGSFSSPGEISVYSAQTLGFTILKVSVLDAVRYNEFRAQVG